MTITLTREEAQQVLEGLENIAKSDWRTWQELADPKEFERWVKSRTTHMAETLRARLAQPEPEPCEWVGLTDEEITALKRNGERYISSQDFARAIEAKLKAKNATQTVSR